MIRSSRTSASPHQPYCPQHPSHPSPHTSTTLPPRYNCSILRDALINVYTLTNVIVASLMDSIRKHMKQLFKLAESIALLDMLTSFTSMVAQAPNGRDADSFCRPTFSDDGPTEIIGG